MSLVIAVLSGLMSGEASGPGLLGRPGRLAGVACLLGAIGLFAELAELLTLLPGEWWRPPGEVVDETFGMSFDLRAMWGMHGNPLFLLAYWAALVWLPWAGWRWRRSRSHGRVPSSGERSLVIGLAAVILALWALIFLTPLKYSAYTFPL